MRYTTVAAAGVLLLCSNAEVDGRTKSSNPNILFIVADDLGTEALSLYNQGRATTAKTPNLDKLAKEGIVFDNVWGSPLSAPVRAAMLTGRYGHSTGVVNLSTSLKTSEKTLHASLPENYANALIGKWHLSDNQTKPERYGIDYFAGLAMGGGVRDYNSWQLTQNGTASRCTEYVTTKFTDIALKWIKEQNKPWFCWLAYTAPHSPIHLPPTNMHTQGALPSDEESINNNQLPYFIAMIESFDYEVGRLLDGIPSKERANTIVILIGDNGTERDLIQSPYTRTEGKGTVYEGGVRIPMIISGAGVSRKDVREDALISATDMYATIMELSGATLPRYEDSYSFKHLLTSEGDALRDYSYSEISSARLGFQNAIRDDKYKMILTNGEPTLFCKLRSDHTEGDNLIGKKLSNEEQRSYDNLLSEIKKLDIDYEALKSVENTNNTRVKNNRTQQSGTRTRVRRQL